MTWIDSYEPEVIELALARLREDGVVWQDPSVGDDIPESLRRERTDREPDSPCRLGLSRKAEPVRSILAWLKVRGVV
ncbi:MAG: hypothetical protein R6X31_10960 [Anaerolineae bacterium]